MILNSQAKQLYGDSELGYLIGMQTHQLGLASHSADSVEFLCLSGIQGQ